MCQGLLVVREMLGLVRRRAGVLLLGLKTSSSAYGAVNGEVSLWTLAQNLADTLR